ncbi:Hypothetical predicted protein [Mytilus galloprovincialis]|uniref:Uncharacterized protein n=1 Tax=Mytilus galloprovincialis TaxID=29158 RepID=A0A8B6GQY0_MYTGA|nr:Hypothetical predicted protein [Mytilus galloprovincialis]
MTLRDSKDAKVRGAKVKIRTGRKWKAEEAVKEAETRLKHSVIVGVTAVGRQGFGMTTKPRWDTANEKGRRELVQTEIRQMEEESRNVKAVGMKQQAGSWLNWQGARSRALTWSEIWGMEGYRLSFLLRSVYDVLPSPSNLYTWGQTSISTACLSACPVALKDRRYTWRHDSVLKTLAAKLDTTRRKKEKMQKNIHFVNFVRLEKRKTTQAEGLGILGTASDWQMTADIHQRMSFPAEIAATSLRPDIVIWSQGTRQAVLLELTVPWEDRIEEAYGGRRTPPDDGISIPLMKLDCPCALFKHAPFLYLKKNNKGRSRKRNFPFITYIYEACQTDQWLKGIKWSKIKIQFWEFQSLKSSKSLNILQE